MSPRQAGARELSHDLLDSVLALRIHLGLGHDDDARHQLERSFHALVALDAAMPPDPPAAIRHRVPVRQEKPVGYLGQDAADLAADRKAAAALGVRPGPLDPPATPTQLTDQDGTPLAEQPPGGHVADTTSATHTGSAG